MIPDAAGGDSDLPPDPYLIEFAYTTWDDSCQDPYSPHYQCRRPRGHAGDHAAGFGAARITWAPTPESEAL